MYAHVHPSRVWHGHGTCPQAKLETERVTLMDQLKAAQEEARRGEGAARVAAEQQARQLEARLEKQMEPSPQL